MTQTDPAEGRRAPRYLPPMLATLTDAPFSREDWIFERKLDGERCLAECKSGEVHLYSRSGHLLDRAYPELVDALAAQAVEDFIADGEIVAFEGSATSFSRLQRRMHITDPAQARRSDVKVVYYLFDLPELLGEDLTGIDLRRRKALLLQTIDFGGPLRFLRHRNGEGESLFAEACRLGWEGVIAKRASSRYVSGRSRDWLKFKCVLEDDFEVVGFTDARAGDRHLGALLLARRDETGLRYVGRVGTGLDDATLASLRAHLAPLERDGLPVDPGSLPSRRSRGALPREGVHWTDPALRVRVGFAEWTPDGYLRHPRFVGVRTDDGRVDP
jgi:bifunctional non-homologous end joining protein LigD